MNREIKFRAFYKEYGDPEKPNGSMFYNVFPCTHDFSEWLISFDGETYDGDFKVGEDIEVMQYTGLKDKNGKEIYEGDILKYDPDVTTALQEVVWNGKGWRVRNKRGWYGDSFETAEVIGNIYENPDLLKP